jgi:hypothetical protein
MSFEYCDGVCDTLNELGSAVLFSPTRARNGYAIGGTVMLAGIIRGVEFESVRDAVAFAKRHHG